MPKYRDGWKPNPQCKTCRLIKNGDERLYERIMQCKEFMKGGESISAIHRDYDDQMQYLAMYNHIKKHQAPSAQQLVVRRVDQLQKKQAGIEVKKLITATESRQTLLDKLNDKLEQGQFDDKMTVKDLIAVLRDTDSAQAKKKDQAIDVMKMMMPHRSGEFIDQADEEFDPWKEG